MAPLRRVPRNPIVAAMSTTTSEGTLAKLARALGPKYEVRRVVGSGGFAEVYEVWDKDLERRLAVKVLRPDVAWTAGTVERFQRETRAAARLEHPNILPIHFVGEGEGLAYYRSEEHTSELQSQSNLVCRLLLEKKKKRRHKYI